MAGTDTGVCSRRYIVKTIDIRNVLQDEQLYELHAQPLGGEMEGELSYCNMIGIPLLEFYIDPLQ